MITQEEIPYNRNEIEAMVKTIENLRKEKSEFIEKACEWLKKNLPPAMVRSDFYMFNGEFIKDFKKAMEHE